MKEFYSAAIELGIEPGYFLDEMEWWELDLMMDAAVLKRKLTWDPARMIAYITAKCSGFKGSPAKLITFPWDDEFKKEDEEEEVDPDELEALRQKVKELNNKNNGG